MYTTRKTDETGNNVWDRRNESIKQKSSIKREESRKHKNRIIEKEWINDENKINKHIDVQFKRSENLWKKKANIQNITMQI